MKETSLELKIIQDMTINVKCDKPNCEYKGNKPVCYMEFYEECKEYKNE